MLTYDKAVENLFKEFSFEKQRLIDSQPLFKIAETIAKEWSTNDSYTRCGRYSNVFYSYNVNLSLYLSKNDSIIKDIGPIIEDLRSNKLFTDPKLIDYPKTQRKEWSFYLKDATGCLCVGVGFSASDKCKIINTGKFEEVQEIRCEE